MTTSQSPGTFDPGSPVSRAREIRKQARILRQDERLYGSEAMDVLEEIEARAQLLVSQLDAEASDGTD